MASTAAHALGAAAALAILLAGCQDKTAETPPRPSRPVLVATVTLEPRRPERSLVGVIRPRVESDLGFRVAGKMARRLVNVGDPVAAGQTLALLDDADLTLQREQAEAEHAAASASLAQAQAELRRMRTLAASGWSTTAAMERQSAAVEEARGRIERALRATALARNAVAYAALAADADGVVTAVLAEPGQVMAAGQPAIRVARLDEKEAVVAIPESQLQRAQGATAAVSLWSSPDRRYPARLRELSPSADPATRTYQARFSLPEAGAEARLGMTATVTLSDPVEERVARLPLSALFSQGEGPALWLIDRDGRPTLRPVRIAAYDNRDVLIAAGVADGDQVVTLGVQKLDPGERVRVVRSLRF